MSAVVKSKNVANSLVYRLIVNGNPADTISFSSSGNLVVPRVGEDVEIFERSEGLVVAGKVTNIFYSGRLSSGGPSEALFQQSVFIDVEPA